MLIEWICEFLEWFGENVFILLIWLCLLWLCDYVGWLLYLIWFDCSYVNIGFWLLVLVGVIEGVINCKIENKVSVFDGYKLFYFDFFYICEEFDEFYGGEIYNIVKKVYDFDLCFFDFYVKVV